MNRVSSLYWFNKEKLKTAEILKGNWTHIGFIALKTGEILCMLFHNISDYRNFSLSYRNSLIEEMMPKALDKFLKGGEYNGCED